MRFLENHSSAHRSQRGRSPHQNEAERRQNAHAAKIRQRVATAHVGVSRIRSAAQDTERIAASGTLAPDPCNLTPD